MFERWNQSALALHIVKEQGGNHAMRVVGIRFRASRRRVRRPRDIPNRECLAYERPGDRTNRRVVAIARSDPRRLEGAAGADRVHAR